MHINSYYRIYMLSMCRVLGYVKVSAQATQRNCKQSNPIILILVSNNLQGLGAGNGFPVNNFGIPFYKELVKLTPGSDYFVVWADICNSSTQRP